jgi:hypothetical protein
MLQQQSRANRAISLRADIEPQTAGVTLAASARDALHSELALAQLCEKAYAILVDRQPLTVSLSGFVPLAQAAGVFDCLCRALRKAADDAQVAASRIEVALAADILAPLRAWQTRRAILGEGPLHLIAGRPFLQPGARARRSEQYEQFWLQLWQLREMSMARIAYAGITSPSCPLLSAEPADTVQPVRSMQVPIGSAWVSMQLNLTNFANAAGALDEEALRHALHGCVDIGDTLHEQAQWATAQMRYDAWLNRRLAIVITGIGDLVMRRRQDPRRFACLRELTELLGWIRSTVRDRSRSIARRTDFVPALTESDPTRTLVPPHARDDWSARWRAALAMHGVRHRNLLALSPWSLFPSRTDTDAGFLDLLPLLEFADVYGYDSPPCMRYWNVNTFREAHQRTWAVLEKKNAQALFAEQV